MPKETEYRILAIIVGEDILIDLRIYHDFEKVRILDKLDYFYFGSMLKFIVKLQAKFLGIRYIERDLVASSDTETFFGGFDQRTSVGMLECSILSLIHLFKIRQIDI